MKSEGTANRKRWLNGVLLVALAATWGAWGQSWWTSSQREETPKETRLAPQTPIQQQVTQPVTASEVSEEAKRIASAAEQFPDLLEGTIFAESLEETREDRKAQLAKEIDRIAKAEKRDEHVEAEKADKEPVDEAPIAEAPNGESLPL